MIEIVNLPTQSPTDNVVIRVSEVTKKFSSQVALDRVSFEVMAGTTCVLLGPNGAGKSTLLNLLAGALQPSEGRISVLQHSAGHPTTRRQTGVMLQISGVPQTLTVSEHINSFRSYYSRPLGLAEVIQLSQLDGLEKKKYSVLSVGQKQKLHFALAICGRPSLLFLDEPSASLDVQSRRHLWDQIDQLRANGCTFVVSTHDFQEAERLASHVVVFHEGRIILNGTPQDLKANFADSRISCDTSLDPHELGKLPHVKRVEKKETVTRLFVNEVENTVRHILSEDSSTSQLEIKRATIEDAYLHLLTHTDHDN